LMNIYKRLNPNLTLAICAGGTFLMAQLALSIIFKNPLGPLSILGILMIVGGITLMAFFK